MVKKAKNAGERLFLVPLGRVRGLRHAVDVGDEVTVGRALDNTMVLVDGRVSKHHTRIYRDGAAWLAEDLASLNGTLLNGVPIGVGRGSPVADGDVLTIGETEFRALYRATPPRVAATEPGRDGDAAPESMADLAAGLTGVAARLVRDVAGADDDEAALRALAVAYFHNPLDAVRGQNRCAAAYLVAKAHPVAEPDDVPAGLCDDLVTLNGRVEHLFYREAARPEDVNPETYDIARNVEFLFHGDILPSHLAILGDAESYRLRELLVAHKYGTALLALLRRARAIGIARHAEIDAGDVEAAARAVFAVCVELYAEDRGEERYGGSMKTLGFFSREGGSCRHRSATLQLMLQEAGVAARYVRGLLMGSGPHAWCEVRGRGDDVLVFDANFAVYGRRDGVRRILAEDEVGPRTTFRLAAGVALAHTDPAQLAYICNDDDFNLVWRPKPQQA